MMGNILHCQHLAMIINFNLPSVKKSQAFSINLKIIYSNPICIHADTSAPYQGSFLKKREREKEIWMQN